MMPFSQIRVAIFRSARNNAALTPIIPPPTIATSTRGGRAGVEATRSTTGIVR
jgi:hypothetical protein